MNQIRQFARSQAAASTNNSRGDGRKFFSSTSRGEISELAADLNSNDRTRERYAVKRIIATMTLGRDVSRLFADVVKLSRTTSIEIKKLVYLYIVTNARLASDKAILAVNTFVQDAQHEHPAIRALALRTMLCLRVEGITDYTMDPLRRALRDSDPYVRRTAAVGLGKVFHQNTKLFEQQQFGVEMVTLLSDVSPMVVAAAASTIEEILQNTAPRPDIEITDALVRKMLTALPECVEWGQCRILALIALYRPSKLTDAEYLIERLLLLLSHTSVCIVLAVGKAIIRMLEIVDMESPLRSLVLTKVSNAYVTLLGIRNETVSTALQYVVCRDIYVLNYKFPSIFVPHIKSFLIRFNDPTYLKLEKLSIMIRLLNSKNTSYVTAELVQYCNDLDVTFVSAVTRAFGTIALVDDTQVSACIEHLFTLSSKGGNATHNEVICVLADILRRYPQHHDLILPTLFGTSVSSVGFALESLVDHADALQASLWMLGEFNQHIEKATIVLENYITAVDVLQLGTGAQLALLTATVKMFNCLPSAMGALLCRVLDLFVSRATCPDVRDRAIMYYRLLSDGQNANILAKVVMGTHPVVSPDNEAMDPTRVNEYVRNLNSVSSILRQSPEVFVPKYGFVGVDVSELVEDVEMDGPGFGHHSEGDGDDSGDMESLSLSKSVTLALAGKGGGESKTSASAPMQVESNSNGNLATSNAAVLGTAPTKGAVLDSLDDLFGDVGASSASSLASTASAKPPPSSSNIQLDPNTIARANSTGILPVVHTPSAPVSHSTLDDLFVVPPAPLGSTSSCVGVVRPACPPSSAARELPLLFHSTHAPGFTVCGMLIDAGPSFAMALQLNFLYHPASAPGVTRPPLMGFGLQVNKNALGVKTVHPLQQSMPDALHVPPTPGGAAVVHTTTVALQYHASHYDRDGSFTEIQMALKTNAGVDYFVVRVPTDLVYRALPEFTKKQYMELWKGLDASKERRIRLPYHPAYQLDWVQKTLKERCRAYVVSDRCTPLQQHLYMGFQTHGGDFICLELVLFSSAPEQSFACVKAQEDIIQAKILESILNAVLAPNQKV